MNNRIKQYSLCGIIYMLYCLIRTKLFYPKSRIIRFPMDVRGKKNIDFGKKLTTGVRCRLEATTLKRNYKTLIFGNNVQINDYVHISAMEKVYIGDNVLMAGHIYISDNSHGYYRGSEDDSMPGEPPIQRKYRISPVTIGANSWIGEHAVILPGVTIGEGVVIGSNSVVSKSIPPFSIAVGSPARVIKRYNFETMHWENIK